MAFLIIARFALGGLLAAGLLACTSQTNNSPGVGPEARSIESFDSAWSFSLGDASNAQMIGVADSGWRRLDVPHEWSIEGTIDKNNSTGKSGGFFPAGIGWYRK